MSKPKAAPQWKFIGAETMRDNRLYSRLGELVEALPDEILSHGGIPALPAEDFDAIFTAEECAAWPYYNQREQAPVDFHDKIKRAAIRLAELRSN